MAVVGQHCQGGGCRCVAGHEKGVVLPRLRLGAGSEPSRTELIPNKEAASQIQLELWLRLRSRLKLAWPSS